VQPVERGALPNWIAQRLAQQNQRVVAGDEGQRTLQFFADRVEGNLLAAHQEDPEAGAALSGRRTEFRTGRKRGAERGALRRLQAVGGGAGRARWRAVQRMLDGLQAEGEAEVLVHYTLAEDIRALKRVKDAMAAGRPLPMALREQRVWGVKEKLFERGACRA
jgi:DNA polymerase-3 subunit delta